MRKDKVVSEVLGKESVLTPSDLYSKQFPRAMVGGYQPQVVDAFLERVADVLESLVVQIRELKDREQEQQQALEDYRQMEAALRSSLVSSQKFAEKLIESARREAETLVGEAHVQRERLLIEHQRIPEVLGAEIRRLKALRDELRDQMAGVLDTHRALLDRLPRAEDACAAENAALFEAARSVGHAEDDGALTSLSSPVEDEDPVMPFAGAANRDARFADQDPSPPAMAYFPEDTDDNPNEAESREPERKAGRRRRGGETS